MELTRQQLSDVLSALRDTQASGASDRRRFSRLSVQKMIEVTAVSPEITPRRFSALTYDISYHGLGMTQAVAVAAGQEMLVHVPSRGDRHLLLRCVVRQCSTLAYSLYRIGTEFVAEATTEFLEQILRANAQEADRIRQSILGA